jgi:hypothetical protein
MDLPDFAKTFFEAVNTINPQMKSVIDLGTSLYTIGSAGVTVLQKGKQLITYAVGKANAKQEASLEKKPKRASRKRKTKITFDKNNVAVVVEVSRPTVQDAVNYLAAKKIDSNLIVITTIKKTGTQSIQGLDDNKPRQWTELVQEFSTAMDAIKREAGTAHVHIFMATPVALAFGLGAVWGTVDHATIYHWNGKEYKHVIKINRELRFQPKINKKSKMESKGFNK